MTNQEEMKMPIKFCAVRQGLCYIRRNDTHIAIISNQDGKQMAYRVAYNGGRMSKVGDSIDVTKNYHNHDQLTTQLSDADII